MKAIYDWGLVRIYVEASIRETHCFVSLMQPLYDGVLLNRPSSKVITDIDECW